MPRPSEPTTPAPTLREFIERAWYVVEPATRFVGGYHVDAIAEHLAAISRAELHNLIINIPPRHSKSSLVCVLWPVWEWIEHPELRWLFTSYGQDLSTRDSVKRRRLVMSEWFQQRWGDRFRLADDQNQKTRFENDRTGVMLASSVGGAGTGEGGHRIVVDDPHKADEVESDARRQAVLDWWDGTMSTRADQPDAASRVIVMQRLHEADLTGHLLARAREGAEQYDHLVLPAEYEPRVQVCMLGKEHDPRTEEGELLSPDRFPREAIERLKVQLGDRAAGQLQQRPAPPGGAIFQREWYAEGRNRIHASELDVNLSRIIARWLSYDTAFKDKTSNDLTARWSLELLNDYRLVVRDLYMERLLFPDLLATIEADARRWNADSKLRGIIIEDKGSGTSAGQSLRAAAPAWLADLLVMFEPIGSKVYRARQASQWCSLGCVLIPHQSPEAAWVDEFAGPDGRLWKFPTLEHDDDIDSFTQGVIYLEHYLAEGLRARQGVVAA